MRGHRLVTVLAAALCAPLASAVAQQQSDDAPHVFLDCDRCDFSFIRVEVPFVNWVRDREDAIVHVLITDQVTGSFDVVLLQNFNVELDYVTTGCRLCVGSSSKAEG
jgi:hypothetical protein